MTTNEENPRVLRVTQLDAHNIDNSIFTNLQTDIRASFGSDSLPFLSHVEPEINALLRYILWRLSIRDEGVTVGQKMFNTQYLSDKKPMSHKQRLIYGTVVVLLPWMKERYSSATKLINFVLKLLKSSPTSVQERQEQHQIVDFEKIYKHFENAIKLLTLLNFLAFLRNGYFVSVLQRLLKLDHVFTRKPTPRHIDYGYMRKELVWESMAQTLVAVLPLLNIRKISNTVSKYINLVSSKDDIDFMTCAICMEKATNPHFALNKMGDGCCQHSFCYFCVQSNLSVDTDYSCPSCGEVIGEITPSFMNNELNELD